MSPVASQTSESVGGFRLIRVLGTGAQGKVWEAECIDNVHGIVPAGTVVALKVKFEHGGDLDGHWQKLESRINELKAIDHANVVRYLGCFRERGLDHEKHVVVQELLEGETLKDRLEAINKWNPAKNRMGLDVDAALDVVSQVSVGLGHTASLGIFHRDVKPGNIFLCKNGTVKLIDFGVARQSDGTITEEGNIRGSWNYLAPDFADGVFRGDQESDIFSVGVVLHEVITGRLPYENVCGDDMAAYFSRWAKTADDSPIRIVSNTRRLLLGIDEIFDRTLTPDRNARYRDFAQLAAALGRIRFVEQKHDDKTFRRLQFIGEGGFGEVFKARWLERDILVAVKMLKNSDGGERFRAEAEVMKKLDDPCFTRFVDFFEDDGRSFLVMSFLPGMPGSSLRDAINRSKIEAKLKNDALSTGGLPKELVLSAFERYARGLGLMHKQNPMIVHRDIKPSNLYYPAGHPERVAIMDLGIVKTGDASTVSGITPCTFDYAPPEIATTRDRGGPGMDIFALGLCMYEALTGKMGYQRIAGGQGGMIQFFDRCRKLKAPVFDDPRVAGDPELLRLLQKMTAPDIAKRMTSADEVAMEIRKLFYRDIESKTSDTRFFNPDTDKTMAISDDELMAWFEEWKKANPVDEKRLMELYRNEWMKEHDSIQSQSVRKIQKRSRWTTPLLMLLSIITTASVVILAMPFINDFVNPPKNDPLAPVPPPVNTNNIERDKRLEKALLELARNEFKIEFDNLLKVEPVDTRRRRLEDAELKLQRSSGVTIDREGGCLFEEGGREVAGFKERIAELKKSAVGIIDNRTGAMLEIDGKNVYAGERMLFEFKDGKLESRKIYMAGHEKKSIPRDFDGKVLILAKEDFVVSDVTVDMPEDMDGTVECLFDGKKVNGALALKPRDKPYKCIFKKSGYDDKVQSFAVELGRNMRLDKLGAWTPSLVEVKIPVMEAGVSCLIDGRRVEEKTLLKPGVHAVKYERRGYQDLKTDFKVEIGTSRNVPESAEIGPWKMNSVRVSVPYLDPGVRCFVDGKDVPGRYCDVLPGSHSCSYLRSGYVPQSNIAFIVAVATPTNLPSPSNWTPEKVKVDIPRINNIQAELGGKAVSGTIYLAPGKTYWLKYLEKGTGRHQSVPFIVQINSPMEAPSPIEANWIDPRPPKPAQAPAPKPAPKPQPADRLVSAAARKEYDTASEYYEYQEYAEAFVHFYNAFKQGYPLSEQDLRNIGQSFNETLDVLNGHIEDWKRRPAHKDSHRNIEELSKQRGDLIKRHREITGK